MKKNFFSDRQWIVNSKQTAVLNLKIKVSPVWILKMVERERERERKEEKNNALCSLCQCYSQFTFFLFEASAFFPLTLKKKVREFYPFPLGKDGNKLLPSWGYFFNWITYWIDHENLEIVFNWLQQKLHSLGGSNVQMVKNII